MENLSREVNDRIRDRAGRAGVDERTGFLCECGDPECRELVTLTLSAYDVRRGAGVSSRIVAHRAE
jgi:hypothetical protein